MSDLMLSSVTLNFCQDGDDDDHHGCMQELAVKIVNAGAGPYFVLTTERCALDNPEELHQLLLRVQQQVFPLFEGE
jgi:hypothetical protein